MAKKSLPNSQPNASTELEVDFDPDTRLPALPELDPDEENPPELASSSGDLQPPRTTRAVELALPWVDDDLPGYTPRKVDLHLTAEQAVALRRLAAGLDACQATLDNGVRVTTGPLAVRWLLEHVGIRADAALPAAEVSDAA